MNSKVTRTGRDRRRHQRINVDPKILKGVEFKALDLSEGGMRLEANKNYSKSKPLNLELNLSGELVTLQAKIMRCEQSHSIFSSNYLLGVKFVNVRASELLKIRRYLESYLCALPVEKIA